RKARQARQIAHRASLKPASTKARTCLRADAEAAALMTDTMTDTVSDLSSDGYSTGHAAENHSRPRRATSALLIGLVLVGVAAIIVWRLEQPTSPAKAVDRMGRA